MKARVKHLLLTLAYWSGLLHLVRFLHRKEIVILTLHGIVEDLDYPWPVMRPHCSLSRYQDVLTALSRYYEFISLDDAVAMLEGAAPIRPHCAVLTFDDAYRNNFDIALPLLRKYNIPAVFFIPTGHVERQKNLWFDVADYVLQCCDEFPVSVAGTQAHLVSKDGKMPQWQQMKKQLVGCLYSYNRSSEDDLAFQENFFSSVAQLERDTGIEILTTLASDPRVAIMNWEEIRSACNAGITIGSHSVDHLKLGTLEDDECIRRQLQDSKKTIEEHVGCECHYLCYPNGSYDDRVIRIARECGYRAAVTTSSGVNAKGCDLFQLNRIGFPLRADKKHIFSHIYLNSCLVGGLRRRSLLSGKNMVDAQQGPGNMRLEKQQDEKSNTFHGESRGDGKERIIKNVWVGWIAQFVYLVAGFILPRMIDNSMGQAALGAWDFSWTLITYFGLVQGGVVSSVNRYIAKYQSIGDIENVNISASSVACVLFAMASAVVLLTVGAYHLLPVAVGDKLGAYLQGTRWVVLWLGLSLTSQVSFAVFGGVLAGSFRWDIHYYINVASRIATLIGMVVVLLLGGGLATLGFVYFLCEAAVLSLRVVYAYRVQPDLRIRPSLVRRQRVKEMLFYGFKTYLPVVGDMLTNQTMNLMVVWFFGTSMLAVYARPRALIRHVQTFMTRYAYVLVPTASSIHARKDTSGMSALLVTSSRTGAYILFPVALYLLSCGDEILYVWMGANYVDPGLFTMMIIAFFPSVYQLPIVSVLAGANMHGKIGVVKLICSFVGVLISFLCLKYIGLGLKGAIFLFGITNWVYGVFFVPLFLHKKFNVDLLSMFKESVMKPMFVMLPFFTAIFCCDKISGYDPVVTVLLSFVVGTLVLFCSYWLVVFPRQFKVKIKERVFEKVF